MEDRFSLVWKLLRKSQYAAAVLLLLAALDVAPRVLASPQGSGICALTAGLRARIAKTFSDSDNTTAAVHVERGNLVREGRAGCILEAGDVVSAEMGAHALIDMPDRQVAKVDYGHPVTVPEYRSGGAFGRVMRILYDFTNLDAASNMAGTVDGATRSSSQSLIVPGLVGGRQYVDRSEPLYVRWQGGTPPYRVEFLPGLTPNRPLAPPTEISGQVAKITVGMLPLGVYQLRITGGDGSSISIPIYVVPDASQMPTLPANISIAPVGERSTLSAAWLLMRGPPEWRLEALSILIGQGHTNADILAQAILTPPAN